MSAKHKREAWKELFKRYTEVWGVYWKRRHEMTLPDLKAHEAEFLPAALSIQMRPVSPVGRWVARVLILLIVVLLIWSIWGRMDIVVNAQGKIIPSGNTKTISSLETASVQALNVKEGQEVNAGDVLIALDARVNESERKKFQGDMQSAWLQGERARAMLRALQTGVPPTLEIGDTNVQGVDVRRLREAQQHVTDQWRDYQARLIQLEGEISRYSQALPLASQRARDFAELAKTRDVSQHAWLEKEQARVDLEGQLANAINQKASLTSETRKSAQDVLNEANRLAASNTQEVQKTVVRSDLLLLTSPVDGTVQQLSVHTVGGVVPAAQPLMQIVPRQVTVEMEAFMENRDVGFVYVGQEAQVKIDAFEYTKYGTVSATVTHVSRDAIQDEKRGLIFSVKLALKDTTMNVKGNQVRLSPGMSGTVEIKTGRRRVIEYVLAPLLQHKRESLNER
jgi:hemolysin D